MTKEPVTGNIFGGLPADVSKEVFEDILRAPSVRIERIISRGHASPERGWYDQEENEWVMVLEGSGAILFEDGNRVVLNRGDYLHIPAHARHKVLWTDKESLTIWLAVFYGRSVDPCAG
jgi:cupin 2 domain-containing protein